MTKPSSSRKMTETTVDEARKATVPNSVDRIGIAAANSADRRAEKPRRLLMASTFKPVPAVPSELASPMHSATMIPVVASSIPCTRRSEEHTSELQSLMRISYAVFCLKQKKKNRNKIRQ